MKFFNILSILFAVLTVLIWLAFMLFYVASSSSDDVTIGMGIILSLAGKVVSVGTVITGLIAIAIASGKTEKAPKVAIITSAIGVIAFISIFLLYL